MLQKLPSYWFIRNKNEDQFNVIKSFCSGNIVYIHNSGITSRLVAGSNTYLSTYDTDPWGYTEISFDDFKRLVLKEEPMCTEKTIKLSLDQAKKMYGKSPEMDELLLANFSKDELTKKELPKSFDELKVNYRGYYITSQGNIDQCMSYGLYKNNFTTEKQAKSALAMAQLSQLMAVYNDGWEPLYDNSSLNNKFTIQRLGTIIATTIQTNNYQFLAFKSAELRDEFLKNFESLIKEYFMID